MKLCTYLGFEYPRPRQFCKSQWQCACASSGCAIAYLAYKWMIVGYLLTVILLELFEFIDAIALMEQDFDWPKSYTNRAKWFIYMTHWAYMILTAQAFVGAVLVTKYHFAKDKSGTKMTRLHKCYWFFNNLANVVSPAVSIVYWTSVYNKGKDVDLIGFTSIHGHILNSVVVVVDLLVTSNPVRLLHFVYSVDFAWIYTLFTFLYFCAGGTNEKGETALYPVLDWNKPEIALKYVVIESGLLMVIHVVIWMLYHLRRFIAFMLGTLDPEEATPPAIV